MTASNGDIFVAAYGSGSIEKIAAADGKRTSLVTGLSGPYGLAIDADGNLIVAESNGSRVSKYSMSGTKINDIRNAVYAPSRVRVFGNKGYVLNSGYISAVDENGIAIVTKGVSPNGLAIRQDGTLVVQDGYNTYTINADGSAIKTGHSNYYLYGLAVDASSTVWAADNSNRKMLKQQADGSFVQRSAE